MPTVKTFLMTFPEIKHLISESKTVRRCSSLVQQLTWQSPPTQLGRGPSLPSSFSHLSLVCFLTLFSIPIVISVTVGYALNPNNKKLLFKKQTPFFLVTEMSLIFKTHSPCGDNSLNVRFLSIYSLPI